MCPLVSWLPAWPCPNREWRAAFCAIGICSVFGAVLFLGSWNASKDKPITPIEQTKDIAPAVVQGSNSTRTQVEMVNVNIHLDPVLILHIHHLSGQLLPTKNGQPPAFDDKLSYIVAIDSAEIGVSVASMSYAMNTYVFGARNAPLKNLTLSIQGNQIKQAGTLNKGVGIPFEMTGTMSATVDGKIRIHPAQVKAAHLPVEGVMKVFGLDMAKLVNTRNTKGVSVEGNDVILDPAQMLPPPLMRGRITAIRIQGDEIIQTFGTGRKRQAGKPSGTNYMWYRGGVLRFGKLTMNDADMQLIDADPTDPFDFFPDHYQEQLVAGYSKTTASGGLLVYMPDYDKISKPLSPRPAIGQRTDRMPPVSGLR
jgi:hypothetical protein